MDGVDGEKPGLMPLRPRVIGDARLAISMGMGKSML